MWVRDSFSSRTSNSSPDHRGSRACAGLCHPFGPFVKPGGPSSHWFSGSAFGSHLQRAQGATERKRISIWLANGYFDQFPNRQCLPRSTSLAGPVNTDADSNSSHSGSPWCKDDIDQRVICCMDAWELNSRDGLVIQEGNEIFRKPTIGTPLYSSIAASGTPKLRSSVSYRAGPRTRRTDGPACLLPSPGTASQYSPNRCVCGI